MLRIGIIIIGVILMSVYIWYNVSKKQEKGEEVDIFIT